LTGAKGIPGFHVSAHQEKFDDLRFQIETTENDNLLRLQMKLLFI
jgi:hypothetical protein